MAGWKKILVEGDAVVNNLATADLTQTSSTNRVFDLNGDTQTLSFKGGKTQIIDSGDEQEFSFDSVNRVFDVHNGNSIRFREDSDNNYVALKADANVGADYTITLPGSAPGGTKILQSNSDGDLSWIDTPSGSGGGVVSTYTNGSDNRVITSSGTDSINGEANLTFNGSQLTVSGRIAGADFITLTTNNRGLKGTTTGSSVVDLIKCNSSDSVEVGTSGTKTVLSGNIVDAGSLEITCGTLNAESINAQEPSSGEITGKGVEVWNFGTSQATQQTKVYYLTTSSSSPWAQSDKDVEAAAKGFLACALGSNATDGMLIRGLVKGNGVAGSPSVGDRVYVGDDGTPTADISGFGSGDFVRVVGHMVSSDYMYFNPSQEYIELA